MKMINKKFALLILIMVMIIPHVSATVLGVFSESDRTIKIISACLDEEQHLMPGTAMVSVDYPNNSVWINNERMSVVSIGIFSYSASLPDAPGFYMVKTSCFFDDTVIERSEILDIPRWVTLLTLSQEEFRGVSDILTEIEVIREYLESLLITNYNFSQEDRIFITESINELSLLPNQILSGGVSVSEAEGQLNRINLQIAEIMKGVVPIQLLEQPFLSFDLLAWLLTLLILALLILMLYLLLRLSRRRETATNLIYFLAWLIMVLVVTTVGLAMAEGVLSVPYIPLIAIQVAGWVALALVLLSILLHIIEFFRRGNENEENALENISGI